MFKLLEQIQILAKDQQQLDEAISQSLPLMFEGFSDASLTQVCESAAKYLGNISAQLKFGRKLDDFEKAVNIITALRVLGSSDNRDAFNINVKTFNILIQKAGQSPQVDTALEKLGQNPSVRSVRQSVETMLKGAIEGGEDETNAAVTTVNKLRLGYERVQNTLASRASSQQPAAV